MPKVAEFIQCDARNYTAGRQGCDVNTVVVHYSGTGAGAHNNLLYFSRSDAGASAHYFIDKDGTLRQSVSEHDIAWHAGNWPVNKRSVGIEVISAGEDFTGSQIDTLASLVQDLMQRYGIAPRNVIRHYDASGKLCPAPYIDAGKWSALHARITGASSGGSDGGSDPSGDVSDLARRVINGEFGNGDARRAALGGRYNEVQEEVNRILGGGAPSRPAAVDVDSMARDVIAGKYGNGDARRAALGASYDAVQARVNELLGGGSTAPAVDIAALADAVIRGDYGNGDERKRRLGANYDAVQAEVNRLLG